MIVPFHSSISVGEATHPATHVALELAALGVRTALLDLDYDGGHATLLLNRRYEEAPQLPSFTDVLAGRVPLSTAVMATRTPNLHVMVPGSGGHAGLPVEQTARGYMEKVCLYEQMESLAASFDLTLVALPDRLLQESEYVLSRAQGFVTVFPPTHAGLRAHELYVAGGHGRTSMDLGKLLAALPYGRQYDRDLVTSFAAQYGAALFRWLPAEEFHEIAVYAGLPLRAIAPESQSAQSVGQLAHELIDRTALRSRPSDGAGEPVPWNEAFLDEGEAVQLHRAFSASVYAEMSRIGQAINA